MRESGAGNFDLGKLMGGLSLATPSQRPHTSKTTPRKTFMPRTPTSERSMASLKHKEQRTTPKLTLVDLSRDTQSKPSGSTRTLDFNSSGRSFAAQDARANAFSKSLPTIASTPTSRETKMGFGQSPLTRKTPNRVFNFTNAVKSGPMSSIHHRPQTPTPASTPSPTPAIEEEEEADHGVTPTLPPPTHSELFPAASRAYSAVNPFANLALEEPSQGPDHSRAVRNPSPRLTPTKANSRSHLTRLRERYSEAANPVQRPMTSTVASTHNFAAILMACHACPSQHDLQQILLGNPKARVASAPLPTTLSDHMSNLTLLCTTCHAIDKTLGECFSTWLVEFRHITEAHNLYEAQTLEKGLARALQDAPNETISVDKVKLMVAGQMLRRLSYASAAMTPSPSPGNTKDTWSSWREQLADLADEFESY